MYRYFLSVISIFKNEAHILEEWLEHYLKEGVEHFYLLNNNSTDNFKDILNKYSQFVELYDARENYTQVKHLNSQLDEIKTNSEWILYSDLDEFVFTKQNYKTLPDTIKLIDNKIDNLGQIRIPWIIFSII